MEKFKDIWASIVSQIHERTTNPLTFSFVISWLIWNYRFIFIAFSELPVKEKLSLIKSFYPDWHIAGQEGFVYPLLTSLAYIFIYPFITIYVVNYYRDHQIRIANSLKRLEKERTLSKEDAAALERRHQKMLAKASQVELESQTEITNLREALQSAEEEISSLKLKLDPKMILEVHNPLKKESETLSELQNNSTEIIETSDQNLVLNYPVQGITLKNNSLTKRQLKILSLLSDGDRISIKDIASDFSVRKFFVDFDLDILRRFELILNLGSNNSEYQITEKGRIALNAFIDQEIWKL